MLVDANVLIYAVVARSPHHEPAKVWLETVLNGSRRIAIPWSSITAFVRIVTNPRALDDPLSPADAWQIAEAWLDAPTVWVPEPGDGFRTILGRLIVDLDLRANLVPDAALAALCIEHGLDIVSADTDFARFPEVTWHNPLAA
jgi:toxin-antitoxin system PIN domain toxin